MFIEAVTAAMVGATTTANIGKVATGPGGATYPLFSGGFVRHERKSKRKKHKKHRRRSNQLPLIARTSLVQSASVFRDAVRRFRLTERAAYCSAPPSG